MLCKLFFLHLLKKTKFFFLDLGNVDKISFIDFVSCHIYYTFISFVCSKLFQEFEISGIVKLGQTFRMEWGNSLNDFLDIIFEIFKIENFDYYSVSMIIC